MDKLLEELATLLANHDWYYDWSDDGSVWRRGLGERKAIIATIEDCKQYGRELWVKAAEMYNEARPNKQLFVAIGLDEF